MHCTCAVEFLCEWFLYIVSGLCVTATANDMSGSANVSRLRSDHNVEVGFYKSCLG